MGFSGDCKLMHMDIKVRTKKRNRLEKGNSRQMRQHMLKGNPSCVIMRMGRGGMHEWAVIG